MTTDRQRTANRKNATRSKGPKSAAGKAKSSQNARTHGLSTPPDPGDVLRWFRIVMNDPEACLDAPLDPLGHAALRLAEAEACLERAERAEALCARELARLTKAWGERDPRFFDFESLDEPTLLSLMLERREDSDLAEGIRILLNRSVNNLSSARRRLETVGGYCRRAEARRRKARRAWMASTQRMEKRSQIHATVDY